MANIFEDGFNAVRELVNQFQEPESIREDIVQPRTVKQPAPVLPGAPVVSDLETIEQPDMPEGYQPFTLEIDKDIDFNKPYDLSKAWGERKKEKAVNGIIEEDLGSTLSSAQARDEHFNVLTQYENKEEKGLQSTATGQLFFPIDSIEGGQEIGYGIKIQKGWLSDNEKDWPVVDGAPVNVREGITKDQAKSMSNHMLDGFYKDASNTLSKSWDDMTEMEKAYWADLTYNGGPTAINKNPKAKAAVMKGYTVEGLVKSLDFIKGGGKPLRGLLNRRVSMYNKAALEIPGAPVIEEYRFGDKIQVKFGSKFKTKKVSKEFADKLNASEDGWYTLSKGGDKGEKIYASNDNFEFWG